MLESFVTDAFEYKKLTEAEQKARGILGRLVGVIADTEKPTRNGRKYSEQLWENVFENPIMKEKIANRCCFGELNHPADRSEVDLERVAICLAEYPKRHANGKLYGVFDILSTPNGRILKALCDYGCKIGISSRGQGDLITDDDGEEAVDPDTYECECFDAVIVPGVEVARLQYVNEGLQKQKDLRSTLTEELKAAHPNARKIMEETLDMLKIKLTEADTEDTEEINNDDIEDMAEEPAVDPVDADTEVSDATATADEFASIDVEDIENSEPADDLDQIELIDDELPETDPEIDSAEEEEIEERTDEEIFLDFLANNFDEKQVKKVCDILDIEIIDEESESEEDEEEKENDVETEDDADNDAEEADEAESDDNINDTEADEEESDAEIDEAKNSGSEFLVSSLKESLLKTAELEGNIKTLQETLAVRDAEVDTLTEECGRYKASIARLSILAKAAKESDEKIQILESTVQDKDKVIQTQKDRIARLAQARKVEIEQSAEISKLNESLKSTRDSHSSELAKLNEQLDQVKKSAEMEKAKVTEQLNKATKLTEGYKNLANTAINKYIDVKAQILGLTAKDIKRKLGESYTIADIDQVCSDLKSYNLNVSKLPFSIDRKVSVRVNEAMGKSPVMTSSHIADDDDVSSMLIRLADFE